MSGETSHPADVLVAHARRAIEAGRDDGVVLRLAGGLGVLLRSPELGGLDVSGRPFHDVDLVGRLRDVRQHDRLFAGLGYEPDRAVNTQFGTVRRVYHHPTGFHVDVFLDRLEFCHRIDLAGRLELHGMTLAPADLLLSKLQIVERNRKDLVDAALLLLNHDLVPADPAAIELDRILAITADDWGFHTTARDFLDVLEASLGGLGLEPAAQSRVGERVRQLATAIDAAPKSFRWRARERVGRRVRWYRVVEEVL
ncbi:MAG: hypothetical protein KatS3mg065_0353 [Chloroflexota bacterium]|nr:MAG: hypothetical protein KatS3mg065_0353 [Chloroflexota bacterium]